MFFETKTVKTPRLTMAYHHAGKSGAPRLMLIHGNASSSLFYLPIMKRLEDRFELVAPDMRCFGESEALPVDATRGMRDFSDDVDAFAEAIGWDSFSLLGWSLGGGIAMQYAIDHGEKLEKLILQSPLSPFGFGGTYDEDGKKLEPVGIASGGGCANVQLIASLQEGKRDFIAQTIDGVYVAPPYQIDPELKEMFIDSVMTTRVGEGMYPGNKTMAPVWPFVAAGNDGICNTMAPNFCDLSGLADIEKKPDVLWIRGAQDIMVSDNSLCDLAVLGKMGIVPGYPGEAVCPPQPMLKQTRYVLEKYKANGGSYREAVIHGGHGCMLDNEDGFIEEILSFMDK
ncbi:MAG: alpha/beta hydrolase [Oscillospiraceae bacterium]|nr:alpha/beta hydrolase [Oscillospiraceae bacterium]